MAKWKCVLCGKKWELDVHPCPCTLKEDVVKKPNHYARYKHEPIDVIRDWGLNFNRGNVVKYMARAPHKGTELQDLKKAMQYLSHEIKALEAKEEGGLNA